MFRFEVAEQHICGYVEVHLTLFVKCYLFYFALRLDLGHCHHAVFLLCLISVYFENAKRRAH